MLLLPICSLGKRCLLGLKEWLSLPQGHQGSQNPGEIMVASVPEGHQLVST